MPFRSIGTRPVPQTPEWGYPRLDAAKAVDIIDAARPPVARVIDGGCASTLACEMSDGPHRLIVNCGGARAAGAHLPPDLAEGLRTTAAHSTLVLADPHSTAVLADGTLGKGRSEERRAGKESVCTCRAGVSADH